MLRRLSHRQWDNLLLVVSGVLVAVDGVLAAHNLLPVWMEALTVGVGALAGNSQRISLGRDAAADTDGDGVAGE